MTLLERALGQPRTRADRVRRRRAGVVPARPPRARRRVAGRAAGGQPHTGLARERPAWLRLPPLSRPRWGWRWLSLLGLLAALLQWQQVLQAPQFTVQRPQVRGAKLLSASQVRSLARLNGVSIFSVDPAAVERRLESYPEIAQATVRVSWPAQVVIEVQERFPVLEWVDGSAKWWLSAEGVALAERERLTGIVRVKSPPGTLRLEADPLAPAIDPELIPRAIELSTLLGDAYEMHFDPQRGFWIEDGWGRKIYFGTEGPMALKVQAYRALLDLVERNRFPAQEISVEDLAAPYYR